MNTLTDTRTIDFKYKLLDKNDMFIKDLDVVDASISFNSDNTIMRSARFKIISNNELDLINKKIKAFMIIKDNPQDIEYPLGVFLCSSPDITNEGNLFTIDCECYDKTLILKEDKFDTRYRVQAGTKYTDAVVSILYSAGIYKIFKSDSVLTLDVDIEFEIGMTKVEAINQLLKAINYNFIYFDEEGTAQITPYTDYFNKEVTKIYKTDKNSVIFNDSSKSTDIYNLPNKIVRYTETPEKTCLKSTYENNDRMSKISIPNRGRVVADIQIISDIADQATLDAYVSRIVQQTNCYETVTFNTRLMPEHSLNECIMLEINNLKVNNKYIETSWNMMLSAGGNMKHTANRVVDIKTDIE